MIWNGYFQNKYEIKQSKIGDDQCSLTRNGLISKKELKERILRLIVSIDAF